MLDMTSDDDWGHAEADERRSMTFEHFEQTIVAHPLKLVATHWNAARGGRSMPAWTDIRPSALVAQLPILWSWKYDIASDNFIGRLAGDAVEAIFGRSFRGASMTDIFGPDHAAIFARHKRVATEPAFFHGQGLVFRHLDRYGLGERIILPLSDSGGPADGILGATVYEKLATGLPSGLGAATEDEEWFALA